jgi:hypothetical protein
MSRPRLGQRHETRTKRRRPIEWAAETTCRHSRCHVKQYPSSYYFRSIYITTSSALRSRGSPWRRQRRGGKRRQSPLASEEPEVNLPRYSALLLSTPNRFGFRSQDISLKKTAWARGQGLWTAAVAPRGPMTAKTRPGRTPENGGGERGTSKPMLGWPALLFPLLISATN